MNDHHRQTIADCRLRLRVENDGEDFVFHSPAQMLVAVDVLKSTTLLGHFNERVTLVMGQSQLTAHIPVLVTCSDYFRTVLKRLSRKRANKRSLSAQSSSKYRIHLPGISAATMESVLEFMYTSEARINRDNVMDILLASCLLQIRQLCAACLMVLSKHPSWKKQALFNTMNLYDLRKISNRREKMIIKYASNQDCER